MRCSRSGTVDWGVRSVIGRRIAQVKQESTCENGRGSLLWPNCGPSGADFTHTEVFAMTLHDPLWTSMSRIQERAEEHARRREIVRLLDRPSGWSGSRPGSVRY